jgi:hypothetical protein
VLSWIGAAIVTFLDIAEDRWQFDRHFSPYLRGELSDYPPTELSWPVYAARPEFLSLSLPERKQEAKNFYRLNIDHWEPIWQLAPLKKWIVESSQYSLQDAPVRTFDSERGGVNYREFDLPGISNQPNMFYVAFDSNTLSIALFLWISLTSIIAVVFFVSRWVIRGFKRS